MSNGKFVVLCDLSDIRKLNGPRLEWENDSAVCPETKEKFEQGVGARRDLCPLCGDGINVNSGEHLKKKVIARG